MTNHQDKWDFIKIQDDVIKLTVGKKIREFLTLAKQEKWSCLDLSALELSFLPLDLPPLTNLKSLTIASNPITILPKWLECLTGLETLNISGTSLKKLPEFIGELVGLQSLYVSRTALTTLPNSIRQLSNLRRLDISFSGFINLPDSIGEMPNLQDLNVSSTDLTTLPASIGQLTRLQHLDVSSTGLTSLPDSIGQLSMLKHLDVSGTDLATLPDSIGQLTNLKHLDVSSTSLNTLPDSIGQLSSLQHLDVSGTSLQTLPDSIGQLSSLQHLDVSGTRLQILPDSIVQLSSLQHLDVSDTSINNLPDSIGQLSNLQHLDVSDTSLNTLPDSIGQLSNLQHLEVSDASLNTLPETIWRLSSLQDLNLSGTGLTTLPEALCQLSSLQDLNLSGTGLTTLPEAICQLNSLQDLNLSGTGLTTLPEAICQLNSLQDLNLSGTGLTTLPEAICQLNSLQDLNLSGTGLTTLPGAICQLNSLQDLNLSGTGLTTLPETIGQLTNLNNLMASNTALTTLPDTLGQLSNLEFLNISNTSLVTLPDSIGLLSHLQILFVSDTDLVTLPESIGQLTSLEILNVSNTGLTSLPESIGRLTNLQILNVSNTDLTSLPESIGQLKSLIKLNVSNTGLTSLPMSIRQLLLLRQLTVTATKLPIPPEIIESSDPEKLLSYFYKKREEQLNEAKLLLVGQGGVGKTSLVRRLKGSNFNPEESKTEGIRIEPWNVETGRGNVKLNVWDFGGQEIMHATHQFFMTNRSLYLLVWDSRQEDRYGLIDYWLELIRSFGKNSPIIIVMNKHDVGKQEIDEASIVRKYPMNVLDRSHFLAVSCLTGAGIKELQEKIKTILEGMDHVYTPWPTDWFKIKGCLEDLQKKTPHLKYKDFIDICKQNNVIKGADQEALIRFLHDLGTVICFRDDPKLYANTVLDPYWITDGVYSIINSKIITINKGLFEPDDLQDILPSEKYPLVDQKYILAMMQKFELCFRVNKNQYLIPELLPKQEPEYLSFPVKAPCVYVYSYNILPSSVISRFIVRLRKYIYDDKYWKTGVVLSFKEKKVKALVRADLTGKFLEILMEPANGSSARIVLNVILCHLHKIHESITSLKASGKIPLSNHPEVLLDHENLTDMLRNKMEKYIPQGYKNIVVVREQLEKVELSTNDEFKKLLNMFDKSLFNFNNSNKKITFKTEDIINGLVKNTQFATLKQIHIDWHLKPELLSKSKSAQNKKIYFEILKSHFLGKESENQVQVKRKSYDVLEKEILTLIESPFSESLPLELLKKFGLPYNPSIIS
uniref:non-specific serine/threonine protein kinase n=1 Tax=Desulfovibrio sp. U5L TaxID=596152 RepID=I2Q1C0_9BACT